MAERTPTWLKVFNALGGVVGLGALGVGSYFLWRAIWPRFNSEDGEEPTPTPLLPTGSMMTSVSGAQVREAEGWHFGIRTVVQLLEVQSGHWLREDAASAFDSMSAAASGDGVTLTVNSAYRTKERQQQLREKYDLEMDEFKRGLRPKAPKPVAHPGWSNHQMGLAADIESANGTNAAFHWLTVNAGRFKFKRTVDSEPWHWEFV
mgnify:FL=1